jgi:hypothetical protein
MATDAPAKIYATPDGRWHEHMPRTSRWAYRLIVSAERSAASHRHYMACVAEAWANLPEHLADEFATPDQLRRWALIRTGYCDVVKVVSSRKSMRRIDGYSVITVDAEGTMTIRTARSQSYAAMGKKEFQESKDAVLGYLAQLIETTPEALRQAAKEHA